MATKRNYTKEYETQQQRGELPDRMERQRARRALDAKGVDRKGKDALVSTKTTLIGLKKSLKLPFKGFRQERRR